MAITRAQMRRQLYRGGGIASVPRRQRYGLGSKWQDFKDKTIDRVRKIIPNEIANVATKAAPFVAPFNPLAAGLMRGFGRLDQRGDLGDALKQGLLTTGLGAGARYLGGAAPMGGGITEFSSPIQPGGPIANMYSGITGGKDAAAKYGIDAGFLKSGAGGGGGGKKRFLEKFGPVGEFLQKGKDKFGEMGMLGQMGTIFAGGTGVALLADKLAGPKQDDETVGEYMARRKSSVAEYLKFYYKRTNPLAGEQEVDEFVTANTREYSAQGGRIGYADKGFVEGDTPEVLGPVTPGKGLGDIDEGDFNLSDLGEYTQMYPSKDKTELMKLIKKLIQLGSPPARAIEIAKQLIKKGMAQGESEGIASLREGKSMPGTPVIPERKFPKPFEIPDNFNPDKKFYRGQPKLSPDATQIPHHLDINPLRTMEFRDRNGNGIEDRAEGIYAEDRDLIPFDPDREKKLLAERFEKYFPDPDEEFAQGGRVGYANGTPEIPENLPTDDYLKELEKFLKEKREREKRIMMAPTQEAASGGRIGYNMGSPREELDAGAQSITYEGNMNPNTQMASAPDPMAELNLMYQNALQSGQIAPGTTFDQFKLLLEQSRAPQQDSGIMQAAKGGRVKYNMGTGSMGLPGAPRMAPDGIEYDMRENGGFQPLGAKEGKDDVKAVLAKNEFVMTADAVRAAGGGSIQKGAQRMYDTMKRLESRVA
tara:strand:+ start:151 stop:2262 length:2112 start_codon:yes stop_codon:yes gene_type:complete